jgi:Rrf2 family transcriptional regulator, nitric oxide-sensitive transcriptional repressor
MRITQFSDIGLRVLIYLSKADSDRAPATIAEIASQFDIAVNHLVKVVGHMARVGWIQATRGRNGGIRLAVEPAALGVGSVLRELEGDAELIDCNARQCSLSQDCRLRSALGEGLKAFYDALDRYTLADMTAGSTGEKIVRMHRAFLQQTLQSA